MKIVSKPTPRAARRRRRDVVSPPPTQQPAGGQRLHDEGLRRLAERLTDDTLDIGAREAMLENVQLAEGLDDNLSIMDLMVGPAPDVARRRLEIRLAEGYIDAAVFHIEGIVDRTQAQRIIKAVSEVCPESPQDMLDRLRYGPLATSDVRSLHTFVDAWNAMVEGDVVILIDGHRKALACASQAYKTRAISEPPTDTTLRGPRQGFVESLPDNLALLRQWIGTPNLWIESITIGHLTHTQVVMLYIKGLASEELLAEIRQRVQRIRTDMMLGADPLMEMIQDSHLNFVPLGLSTERTDRVVGNVLEGRVALLVNNSPFALVLPMEYGMMFQAADDYYEFVPIVTLITTLRVIAFWVMILLPGFFVAVLTFHQELLPTPLLIRIVADRAGVPFPVALEVLLMELVFELLREAGLRLPRAAGSAVTIVGALILGEAAINAGLVSPSVIVTVAATAICSFVLPTFSFSIPIRLLRFPFIALGALLGLLGVELGLVALIAFLCSHRSFGHPFMSPMAPVTPGIFTDYVFRHWKWGQSVRPLLTGGREPVRQTEGMAPRQTLDPERVGAGQWNGNDNAGKSGE